MFFFLLSLFLCLALSAALLIGLLRSLQVNWNRKNRRPIGYLTPVLLSVLFLFLTLSMTVPRLLDALSVLAGDYVIEDINARTADIHWCSVNENDRQLTFNPWQFQIEAGRTYRVTRTPRSGHIVELIETTETSVPFP